MLRTLALLLSLAALPAAAQVSVTGQAEVTATPDMATLSLSVARQAPGAVEATRDMADATAAVLARLRAAGVEPRDIATSGLRLDRRYDHSVDGPARPVGFEARQSLSVRVRDLDALGPLIDAVVTDGATGLDGIAFGLSDPAEPLARARRAAVADAVARAELYADAAGIALGPIARIAEDGAQPAPQPMMAEMAFAADARSVPTAPGEATVTARVAITWAIAGAIAGDDGETPPD
ncbi:MAG: SIMPL domain-containing protein [Paracoccaceae bacterium]